MHRERTWAGVALSSTLAIAAWGCGGGSPPRAEGSLSEAKVHGKVLVRGQPLTEGEVVFNAANAARTDVPARPFPIKKDGTYEATTLVGRNSVRIAGPALEKDPQLGYAALTCDVKAGDNSYDIELPPPGAK
jgi:hypothetical protein